MSGERITLLGGAMAAVVQGAIEVKDLVGRPAVVIGGLAVLARLSTPYRATVDLDVVDRLGGERSELQVLRAADGAQAIEPSGVLLPTAFGPVKVDVLEVRQVELDQPSDDPGDRLHAASHAWAFDTATELTLEVVGSGMRIEVRTPVAEPGPLIAMKLQSVMNRSTDKQGTDLLDVARLAFDQRTRPAALGQLASVNDAMASDIALHVDLWLVRRRQQALRWMNRAGGTDLTIDDVDLVAELLTAATRR